MIPTASPTIDPARIQLLHSIQNQTIPVLNAFLLMIILHLPFLSEKARFDLYFSLIKTPVVIAASHHFSPLVALVLIEFYPLLLLAIVILFIIFLIQFFNALKLLLESFLAGVLPQEEQTYLELIFPSQTAKSALATEQLYKLLHTRGRQTGFWHSFIKQKKTYSLEIVSSRDQGIRYIMVVPKTEAHLIHQTLLAYLPGLKIKEITDYLDTEVGPMIDTFLHVKSKHQKINEERTENNTGDPATLGVVEFTQGAHFALPLQDQKALSEHDQISFLTSTMTKLFPGELIAFQIVATPVMSSVHSRETKKKESLKLAIAKGKPITPLLQPTLLEELATYFPFNFIALCLQIALWIAKNLFLFVISIPSAVMDTSGKSVPILTNTELNIPPQLNAYEKELHQIVKEKLGDPLFETTIRVFLAVKDDATFASRVDGIVAASGPFTSSYQSLVTEGSILPKRFLFRKRLNLFKRRQLSIGFGFNPILSASELSDLYHFPYTDITKVEGLVKSKSKDLPAPLSMKRTAAKLDVVIGKNSYGGEENPIGLTLPQRRKHMYVLGKTGMGKTTLIEGMICQDMENGKGLMYIDPHGDSFKRLLQLVPPYRKKDVIVLNPADRQFPFGLNILSPAIQFDDPEEGEEWISSAVISVFLKLTDKQFWGPRLEHILRNTILTALQTEKPQLYVIQKLLTTIKYQKIVAADLTDPILKQFWADEFSLMGNMQQSSAISPITHRIGKFITNKMSRHILLQEKSTVNIQKAMDEGKIILVNLAKGELGEDVSSFFGSVILSLVQLCSYQRLHIPENERQDFFVYVDEFQNFATPTFSQMFSEGRKFRVDYILSHQDINQIEDMKDIKTIAGNSGNLTIFRASPDDEAFILPYMDPEVEKGEIVNLLPHHFFMKVTSDESEDAFSGVTIPVTKELSPTIAKEIATYTRNRYTTPRETVEKQITEMVDYVENQIKGLTKNQTPDEIKPDDKNSGEIRPKKGKKRGIK